MPLSRGPTLPYKVVAGVVPCRGSWLVASCKVQGVNVAPEDPRLYSTIFDVLDEKPTIAVVVLHAPIGGLDQFAHGGRTCDREARSLLGPRRGSAVQSAPTRQSFDNPEDESMHLDAVTRVLLPRFREIDAEMAPYHQRTVYEANPELSFYEINGGIPLVYAKHFEAGRDERRSLLTAKIPGIERILDFDLPGVSEAHLLDAGACAWTARRIVVRAGVRIPSDPEWDTRGRRMEIVR